MKILVVGGGAREHALVRKLKESPRVTEIVCAPGNAGIARDARTVEVGAEDLPKLCALAREEAVDLVVVGPDAPVAMGLVDALAAIGIAAFGPVKAAARLEASKAFAKEVMAEAGIPTAAAKAFTDAAEAEAYVRSAGRPLVVKADGLCAGKGVVVASDEAEAIAAIRSMLVDRVFGEAGATILLEDTLRGPEVSFHAICDGERFVSLAAAQDHKRLLEGDRGPNTGGMGAYSPTPMVDAAMQARIEREVIAPLLTTMQRRGAPFRGVIFVGLMIVDGAPQVLEFNCRFGDPETEVLLTRMEDDLLPYLEGAAKGRLPAATPRFGPAAMTVVLASAGYPAAPRKGDAITGLDAAAAREGVTVFHAGTRAKDGALVTNGGRVLAVTARGSDLDDAAARAYAACDAITFEGKQLRRDIGWQARSR
ncbi:MAG: phosphoribosylamine--glycine ligase [Sandaracinus sp.]